MPRRIRLRVAGFPRGLSFTSDSALIGKMGGIYNVSNMRLSDVGLEDGEFALERRRGSVRLTGSALGASDNSGIFYWSAGGQLLLAAGTTLYYSTSTSIAFGFTTGPSSFAGTAGCAFAAFHDASANVCYIVDGTNKLWKWTGSTLSSIATAPANLKTIAVYNNRLFATDGSNTIYWSGLNNGDTLNVSGSGGGNAVIQHYQNDPVRGLMAMGQSLFIFQTYSIARFTGWSQDDFNLSDGVRGFSPSTGVGPISSPSGYIALEHDGYFHSALTNRVYRISESGIEDISNPIVGDFGTAFGYFNTFFVHVAERQEVWFVRSYTGTAAHAVYLWNYRRNAWVGKFTLAFNGGTAHIVCGTAMVSPTGSTYPLIYGSDGYIRRVDFYGDSVVFKEDMTASFAGGDPLTGTANIKAFDFGGDEVALRRMVFEVDNNGNNPSSNLTAVMAVADQAGTMTAALSGVPRAGETFQRYYVNVGGRAQVVDFLWTDQQAVSGSVAPARLRAIEVEGFTYGPRPLAGAYAFP